MEKIKQYLPYLAGNLIAFYSLPFLIKDTGSAMLILLVVAPIICFILGAFYRAKNPNIGFYPLLVGVLFLPSIFIFYNSSALIYAPIYAVLALLGSLAGQALYKGGQ